MLVLTRKPGQSIMIGDDVVITVQGVNGKQVSVGVHAPQDLPVHREEIYHKIQSEKSDDSRSDKPKDG